MKKMKIYSCCICHKKLDYRPVRLIKQEYGAGKYNQYAEVDKYDFCNRCYRAFDKFVNKYKEE